jgi:hypothetical protein
MTTFAANYWPSGGAQKMRFIIGGDTHVCAHNPTQYPMAPLSKAQASTPVQMGPNLLAGGVEFAPGAMTLEWDQMSYTEYQELGAFNMLYCTMIDMYDNGYQGWLILNSYTPTAAMAQMVGQVQATFVVAKPANGLISTVNILSPGILSSSVVTSGGSLASGTTLYYALTFFSLWGESALSSVITVNITSNNSYVNLSWTGPTSGFYRKARLYIATSSFTAGSSALVKAEVYSSFTQEWTDYNGTNGVTATTTTPTSNNAFTGIFAGGLWQNMT